MTAGIPGRQFLYRLYARRLRKQLAGGQLPRHVGIIMDGNRRWARRQGMADPSLGHQYGAHHVENVLNWCEKIGIRHVTVFVCSTENLLPVADLARKHEPRDSRYFLEARTAQTVTLERPFP